MIGRNLLSLVVFLAVLESSFAEDVNLPRNHGQIWKRYAISAYTSNVAGSAKPEQAVIDWVLRDTGTDVWFSEPFGVLSADRDSLYVYHTPEMQRIVRDVVDRLVQSRAERYVIGTRLVTVNSPNWRSKALGIMKPISVKTPGLEAWLLSKENAAILIKSMQKRSDFRDHHSRDLVMHNGQSESIARMSPRTYFRAVRPRNDNLLNHQLEMGKVNEGFSLYFSTLIADGKIDAVIKCDIDQVESFVPVTLNIPSVNRTTQPVQIQVPQVVKWRLHERFRWPTDKVLLISCGVVATPGPGKPGVLGVTNPFSSQSSRADTLLFLETKGTARQALVEPPSRPASLPR